LARLQGAIRLRTFAILHGTAEQRMKALCILFLHDEHARIIVPLARIVRLNFWFPRHVLPLCVPYRHVHVVVAAGIDMRIGAARVRIPDLRGEEFKAVKNSKK
jgi:hypothetical protein